MHIPVSMQMHMHAESSSSEGGLVALVCQGFTCYAAAHDPQRVAQLLAQPPAGARPQSVPLDDLARTPAPQPPTTPKQQGAAASTALPPPASPGPS